MSNLYHARAVILMVYSQGEISQAGETIVQDNTVHEQQVMRDWEALSVAKHTCVLVFPTPPHTHYLTF